jgi:hypothetical protein
VQRFFDKETPDTCRSENNGELTMVLLQPNFVGTIPSWHRAAETAGEADPIEPACPHGSSTYNPQAYSLPNLKRKHMTHPTAN